MTTQTNAVTVPFVGTKPIRAYEEDGGESAGSDLLISGEKGSELHDGTRGYAFAPGETKLIPTQTSLTAPEGTFAMLVARSSLPKRGLQVSNSVGIVDRDYTGKIHAWITNISDKTVLVREGDALMQVVFVPFVRPSFQPVEELNPTARGGRGFGSSDSEARGQG